MKPLLDGHLADLRKSGLSDAQIAACGFYSTTLPSEIGSLINWKSGCERFGPCLVIPYLDSKGRHSGYNRLKPDRPRLNDHGKTNKYEAPLGIPYRAYFPPGCTLVALPIPSTPLLFTEGEKKAAKADQEGFPCVGLVGVYGWQKKRGKDKAGFPQGDRELI